MRNCNKYSILLLMRQLNIYPNKTTFSVQQAIDQKLEAALSFLNNVVVPEQEELSGIFSGVRAGNEAAICRLQEIWMNQIVSIARQVSQDASLAQCIDLGKAGLLQCVKRLLEDRLVLAYANWWIRQSILEGLSHS